MLKAAIMGAMVLLALPLSASSAGAQSAGAAEIGYDLGISVLMPDGPGDDVLFVSTPRTMSVGISTVRAGFYLSPHSELEPSFGLQILNTNDETVTQLALGLDYLHNFGREKTRLYLKGGGRVAHFSFSGESESQFGVDAGVGAKSAIGDRAALRYGLELVRQFEGDQFAARWDVGFLVGISVFTK